MKKLFSALFAAFLVWAVYYAFGFIISGIDLPLFGDEAYGYGSAIRHMAVHGISLQPKNIPYDYAFGHPQLHTASVALFTKFTGLTATGLHQAQLLWNGILLSLTVFILLLKIENKISWKTVVLFFAIGLTQPIILTQSYMLSSEFMLGTLLMAVFILSWERQYFLAALFGIASVWVKETGVFSVGIIFMSSFIKNLNWKHSFNAKMILACVSISSAFGAYVLLQKYQMGYFLSPTHTGKMSFTVGEVWFRFWGSMKFVFLEQGRFLFSLVLLGYATLVRFRLSSKASYGLSLAVLFCLFSAILGHPLARYLLFPVLLLLWVSSQFLIHLLQHKPLIKYAGLILVSAVLVLNILTLDPFQSVEVRDVDKSYRKELFEIESAE